MGGVLVVIFGLVAPVFMWVDSASADIPEEGGVLHFHFDHVGSTQAISDGTGALVNQVRYDPYGGVRGRFDGDGVPVAPGAVTRQEFGGYVSHAETGLQLAGMRIYDSLTGQFLQHDPAGQFTNPYSYGPGDPINGRDPTGAFFLGLPFWVGVAVTVAAASVVGYAIYTGIATGDVGEAFAALFMGGIKLFLAVASILAAPLAAAAGPALVAAQQFAQIAGLALLGLNQWSGEIGSETFGAVLTGISVGLFAFGLGVGIANEAVSGEPIAETVSTGGGGRRYASNGASSPDGRWVGGSYDQMMEIIEGGGARRISATGAVEWSNGVASADAIAIDGVFASPGKIYSSGVFDPAVAGASPSMVTVPGGLASRAATRLLNTKSGSALFSHGGKLNNGYFRIGWGRAWGKQIGLGKGTRWEVFRVSLGAGPDTRHLLTIPLRMVP